MGADAAFLSGTTAEPMLPPTPPCGKEIWAAALYVHVPFCIVKCRYCDFYSVAGRESESGAFLDALETELAAAARKIALRPRTVFIGGGTPTRLSAEELRRLGAMLARHADLSAVEEWTTEANPATVDEAKAAALLEIGVNRISFGGQSFDDAELRLLGREHSAAAIGDSVRLARRAGFRNLNLDLIFGLPGQTLDRWRSHLEAALALEPDHLSCYDLIYEPGTEMTRELKLGRITPNDEDVERDMYAHTLGRLADAGFAQYEVSNFARPGRECRHNLVYWNNEEYLGLGPSAVSYIDGERRKNVVNLDRWLASVRESGWSAPASRERLTGAALAGETAMLQLRLRRGIDVPAFRARFGLDPLEVFAGPVRRFAEAGLLEADARRIRITDAGLFVSDTISAEFLLVPSAATAV